jgi:hypothetical protein
LSIGFLFFGEVAVFAQGVSNNFRIDESFIGPGGNLEASSNSYRFDPGQQSVGNTGVTESASTTYTVQQGAETTNDPRLACILDTVNIDFGPLSTSVSTTANASFSVLNYTSYGYVVNIVGDPPATGTYTLRGLDPAEESNPGTEQFGINLADNTAPDIGASPVQVPDSDFSSGAATDSYDDPDWFRYVAGEAIASANKSSGQTDYTISYLVNVSSDTGGGEYSGQQTIVCTGTY